MKTYVLSLFLLCNISIANESHSTIKWLEFDKNSFELANQQQKFIFLDLVAVWCHWCHVMDEKTYTDDKVVELLNQHFITTQADHDLRPDLAERYRDWGWPATIILTADGTEIVKRAGYINPESMSRLLQAIIDDPSPETTTLSLPKNLSDSPYLSRSLVDELTNMHLQAYDPKLGSLKLNMKFLDIDSIEWDLHLIAMGDNLAKKRVTQTLDNAMALIDPEFGGAYQYSTHGDWQHPHYEKIMNTQYKNLFAYSSACAQLHRTDYCDVAKQIADYLLEFLYSKQKNVFYTSQDADLKQGTKAHEYFKLKRQQRVALGLPRIDKHIYSSHNGKAIEGMVHLYLASKDMKYLTAAVHATNWIVKNRNLGKGGYKHYKRDTAGPYLPDSLYMGRAFLLLSIATSEVQYLDLAMQTLSFIQENFINPKGGLISAVDNGTPTQPLPKLNQNIDAVRFFMHLYAIKPSTSLKETINHTMKLLATKEISTSKVTEAGVLLAHNEYILLNNSTTMD